MSHEENTAYAYLRPTKKFPNVWCSGCGIGIVMSALIRAVDRMGLDKDDVALVSGIGCTGRMPVYLDFNTMHTTHGRALAFATGLKIAQPRAESDRYHGRRGCGGHRRQPFYPRCPA